MCGKVEREKLARLIAQELVLSLAENALDDIQRPMPTGHTVAFDWRTRPVTGPLDRLTALMEGRTQRD